MRLGASEHTEGSILPESHHVVYLAFFEYFHASVAMQEGVLENPDFWLPSGKAIWRAPHTGLQLVEMHLGKGVWPLLASLSFVMPLPHPSLSVGTWVCRSH